MKRLVVIIAFLTILILSTYAATTWKEYTDLSSSQSIVGYVDNVLELTVSPFMYDGANNSRGLNLDVNADTNYKYQIAPTTVPRSVPGLLIGTFSILSSSSNYKLTITPEKLKKDGNPNITFDYEICAYYTLQIGKTSVTSHEVYCDSTEPAVINFAEENGNRVLVLQNAGLYFRLLREVNVTGDYSADIEFKLESLQ